MILLKDGNVLNMTTGLFEQKDILLHGDTILQVSADILVEDVLIISCENQWLIPGLIDMHVHIKENFAQYFTAAGVTTVRNTAGSIIELEQLMKAAADSFTPRVISADRMIDGPPGIWGADSPYNVNITEEQAAREEVRRQVELGAHFIKVYGWLDPMIMEIVVDEARQFGKEVSCDILHSKKMHALDAAKMGIKWVEHCSGVLQAMYPNFTMNAPENVYAQIPWNEPDEALIQDICKQLLQYDVAFCPTLTLYDQLNLVDQYWKPEHLVANHIHEIGSLIKMWENQLTYGDQLKKLGQHVKTIQKIAHTYFEMGGTVVAGTDTPAGIFTYPGLALHRELQLFVEAGFTSFEAIFAATSKAAQALNIPHLGKIQEGFTADILVLNDNPLKDIEQTMNIAYVVKGGQVHTPQQLLNEILSEEEYELRYQKIVDKFNELGLTPTEKV
ncbi:MAG: amidohydrolase family protein [Solibacillus sp.]|uniref:amidohydrolase family protein n=1 Tax=Solibacillus sp. TaxID=1909654 RepID=UPI003314890F